MNGDNGPNAPARGRWQIVVTMNEQLAMNIAHNCPSGDTVEMMLYRALKWIERELTAGRLFKVEEPKITVANSIPKGLA